MKVYLQSLLLFVIFTLLQCIICIHTHYDDDDTKEIQDYEEITANRDRNTDTYTKNEPNLNSNTYESLVDDELAVEVSHHSPGGRKLTDDNSQENIKKEPIKAVAHFLTEFKPITLKYYIKRAAHDPVCALYTSKESSLDIEKKINTFWTSLQSDALYGSWRIGVIQLTQDLSGLALPPSLPTLRCYIGTAATHEYHGKGTKKHLHKWFKKLYSLHIDRLPEAHRSTIDDVITTRNLTVLAFPGTVHHYDVEMVLVILSDRFKSVVNFLMVHPSSIDEDGLKRRFSVQNEPTAIVLSGEGWTKGSTKTLARFTDYQVTQENLESFLVSQTSTSITLNLNNFRGEVIEGVKSQPAILVCFHAPWGIDNSHYLDVFHHSQQTLRNLNVDLRFGIVDLLTDAEVVHRWVDASNARSVPFTVLFWFSKKLDKHTGSIHQTVLQSGLPTTWNLAKFIQMQGLPLVDTSGNELEVSVLSESSEVMFGIPQSSEMCASYGNTTQDQVKLPNIIFKPKSSKIKLTDKLVSTGKPIKKIIKRIGTLIQISKSNWHSLIETSESLPHPLPLVNQQTAGLTTNQPSVFVKVSVVVFVRDKCSNCARKLGIFEKVKNAAAFIEGSSVYIMNCSDDVDLCERLQIRGFPTVSAFRSIKEDGVEHCLSMNRSNLIRVDYHGYIEEKQIMDWFSYVSIPVAELSDWMKMDGSKLEEQDEEVRVIATLLPRRLAYHYLRSASGHTAWFPYECLRVACEHLFGVARCYGAISKNIPDRELKSKEEDLVVSQIVMQRKDGVEALIMRANTALFLTLQDDSTQKLHKFHTPHRYNVRSNQRCEDDHSQCTDVISSFIRDHSRLPVTHLTMDSFHTSTGFAVDHDSEGNVFSSGHPVLIALVHRENISSNSIFLEALTEAAYTFYNKMLITTLAVEEFPQWATRFVPHGYHRHVFEHVNEMTEDNVPSLHIYPRLCIVRGNNHQRAAFYPHSRQFQLQSKSHGRTITVKEINVFVNDFLDDPEGLMVKTEHF